MIKNYKLFKESQEYRYPYKRIIILINSIQDYHKVTNYLEETFDIRIIQERNYLESIRITHIALNVDLIYKIIESGIDVIEDITIMRFAIDDTLSTEHFLNRLRNESFSGYYNEKDILYVDELGSINSLLKTGEKKGFKSIYNIKRENIYESLLDYLKGPTEEEIENGLRKEYTDGRIDIQKWYEESKRLNIEGPTPQEIERGIRNPYYEGKIDIVEYNILCKIFEIDIPKHDLAIIDDDNILNYVVTSSIRGYSEGVIDNIPRLIRSFNNNKIHKSNITFIIKCIIQYDLFFKYIDFIYSIIQGSSKWLRGYEIVAYTFIYNKLDILKFTLEENLYPGEHGSKDKKVLIDFLGNSLYKYQDSINDEFKSWVKNHIKKLQV